MTTRIERHNPDGVWKGRAALYSHCVRVTNATTTLYIAGQLARDEQGQTVGVGDIRVQTAKVIENIRTILRAEGGDLANLVKMTVYTTDMRFFDVISEVRRRYFASDLPTSTIVEVAKLAQPDLLIEIESIAVL
ncbi:MAG: RidA family protein [Candidatus Rokubacteria bacterium]|nr:RidA family protein [Candidatus Rokubacteria bacterium]